MTGSQPKEKDDDVKKTLYIDMDNTVVDFKTSAIDDWTSTGLDQEPDGSEYRPGSLYMEATR